MNSCNNLMFMTDHKLLRYLDKQFVPPIGHQKLNPVIITDSKARHIVNYCRLPIENNIRWWYKSGQSSTQGLQWLKDNIKHKIGLLDNIALYVWLVTCDIADFDREGKYITLQKEPADAVHKLINNLQEIVQLFSAYPECKLIFLEVPVFSIFTWNKLFKHPEPNQFIADDNTLISHIHEANAQIRQLNNITLKRSPNFSSDMYHPITCKSKNTHRRPRDLYNFHLYKDGLHQNINWTKVWLRKIAQRIKIDCY